MLDKIDMTQKIEKKEFNSQIKDLRIRLSELQREIIERQIPVLIALDGWSAAGKGTCISKILYPLDPRGFNVYTMEKLSEEAAMRPYLWNYWIKTPLK